MVGVSVSDVVGVVDVIGVAEVSNASDWNAFSGVVDQLLCDGSWALLQGGGEWPFRPTSKDYNLNDRILPGGVRECQGRGGHG